MAIQNKNLLISFGCSWTYGMGANYISGMTKKDFENVFENEYQIEPLIFRKIISNKLDRVHINFSDIGSSNQRQFRLAREFFLTKDQEWFDQHDVIVLWGLTSLYRNEFYSTKSNDYYNFFLTYPQRCILRSTDNEEQRSFSKILLQRYFKEEVELKKLSEDMTLFNNFFEYKKITNYWFNTFNPHTYPHKFHNLLFEGNDLLSILINDYTTNDKYHISDWDDTDLKITKAKEHKLVNPFSGHPTRVGHKIIADRILQHISTR